MKALDIVLFGGSGDLSLRKLMPSLYFLQRDGKLPEGSRVTAVSRGEMTSEVFRALVIEKLKLYLGSEYQASAAEEFVAGIDYMALDIASGSAWGELKAHLAPSEVRDIIYYMAVPPGLFGPICKQLHLNSLNPPSSRLVVEKPLGEDEESAEAVNALLSTGFAEEQIYRIDHYLGKEAIQNLLALRFSNRLIGAVWNQEHIESVQITVAETVGLEGRAAYLDHAGVLRDMVQNHLMQILCCLAMETPLSLAADDIRDAKVRVVKSLRPITSTNIEEHVVRAQYGAGAGMPSYLQELQGSRDAAGTGETYAALKVMVDNDRWHNVPFYLRTGKRLKERFAEVIVKFRPTPRNLFGVPASNQITIELQPDMKISLDMFMKQLLSDGRDLISHRQSADLAAGSGSRIPDAYEKLLGDVMQGNQAYFVRHDEIIASWRWIDGIRKAWREAELPMHSYAAGSMGPQASKAWFDEVPFVEELKKAS